MLEKIGFGSGIIAFAIFAFCGTAAADAVKLKNGSSFEGRILEDTGYSIKMQLGIGVVEFQNEDILEVVNSPEVETQAIEKQWSVNQKEEEPTEEEALENYLNTGKVKYQGRWISKEVHEVLKKEKDIKEKRYRFIQQKKREEEKKRQQEIQRRLEAERKIDTGKTTQSVSERLAGFNTFGEKGDDDGVSRSVSYTTITPFSSKKDSSESKGVNKAQSFRKDESKGLGSLSGLNF